MKGLALQVFVLLLRAVYAPMKLLPCRRRITIISRQSDHKSIDIRLLSDYLRREHPDVECRILCRFIEPGLGAKLSYAFHMLRQMQSIATSRVVVLDGYCIAASVLHHKKETAIIQMWHAIAAIKKFGYQTIDRPGGHSRVVAQTLCMHRNYDYILCPSQATREIFCQAFDAPAEKLLLMGLPRLDLLAASGAADEGQTLRQRHGILEDRELLLYVPTYRKDSPVPLTDLIAAVDASRYILAIRLHPLEAPPQTDQLPADGSVILAEGGSTEEWIRAADRIITDYSALSVEAALTGKPLYFYVYDIEGYEQKVGLNVDPRRELPGATAQTGPELAQLLDGAYPQEALQRFRNKYITVETDACTARLGEFIHGIAEEVH